MIFGKTIQQKRYAEVKRLIMISKGSWMFVWWPTPLNDGTWAWMQKVYVHCPYWNDGKPIYTLEKPHENLLKPHKGLIEELQMYEKLFR